MGVVTLNKKRKTYVGIKDRDFPHGPGRTNKGRVRIVVGKKNNLFL